MSLRNADWRAVAAFLLVAAIGAAFIRTSLKQDSTRRQLAQAEAADLAVTALQRDVEGEITALEMPTNRPTTSSHRGMITRGLAPAAGDHLAGFNDPDDWRAGTRVSVPQRNDQGRMQLLLRDREGVRGAVLDVDALCESAGLKRWVADGGSFRLSVQRASGPVEIARGGPGGLSNARERSFVVGTDRWALGLEAFEDPATWRGTALQAVIVLALALLAGLATHDARSHRILAARDREKAEARLSAARKQLADAIQERQALEQQFSHASFHDAASGLPNRRHLLSHMKQALEDSRTRGDRPLAAMVIELERFDALSDSIGTSLAGHLLLSLARRLEKTLDSEPQWKLARLREAQFAMASAEEASRDSVLALANRLHQVVTEPVRLAGQVIHVNAHIGLAFSTTGYDHPEDVLRGAQIAVTRARSESVRVAEFTASAQEQLISRHQLESDLHGVASRGELRLNYQPIVSLADGRLVGFEALVRWMHPREGLVSPGVFISLAEETGLIAPITRWVLREACRQAAEWRALAPPDQDFYLSANLSGQDMRQPDIAIYIGNLLDEASLPAGTLRLEVTEGSMISDVRAAVELITRFRERGVRILLDDFGTGYSSLSYLHRFPIDYLKIDQSFVRRLTPDRSSSGIVRAIMHLAEGMSILTVAEGIETAEAVQLLKALKCTYGQGYHFSKPVDAAAAGEMLKAGRRWDV